MALINKINVGDTIYDLGASLLYGVCETASATAAKVVTVTGNFTLETGATIAVKFTNTNTASSPTLNVNGTGAKAIKRYGTTAAGTDIYSSWQAEQVVIFIYDGTQWQRTYNETNNGDFIKFIDGGGTPIRLAGLVNSVADNSTTGTNAAPLYSNMYIQRSSNDTACDNIYNARLGANQDSGAVIYIEGPNTDTTAGTWTGSDDRIIEYYNGLTIIYVPAIAGADTTTLNINGLGAKTCYTTNESKLTTQYSVGVPILLTFQDDAWKRADYNSNTDTKVRQYFTDGNKNYPLLMGYDVTGTTTSNYKETYARHNNNFYINPNTGLLTVPKLTTTGDVSIEGLLSVNGISSSFGSEITIYNKSFSSANGSAIVIKMPEEMDATLTNVNGYGFHTGHGISKSAVDVTPYYLRCYNSDTAIQLGKSGLQIGTGLDTSDVNALTGLKVKIDEDGQLTLDSSLKSQWQTALGIIDYNSTGLSMINKTINITNRQNTEFTELGLGYLELANDTVRIGTSLDDGFFIEETDTIFKINTNGVPEGDSTSKTGWRNYLDIYVQDTEPNDNAPVGAIWIDTSVPSITYAEDVAF